MKTFNDMVFEPHSHACISAWCKQSDIEPYKKKEV